MSEPFYRATLSLPATLAKQLNECARRVGCSQSALVSILLDASLPDLIAGLDDTDASAVTARRMRGDGSPALVFEVRALLVAGRSAMEAGGVLDFDAPL